MSKCMVDFMLAIQIQRAVTELNALYQKREKELNEFVRKHHLSTQRSIKEQASSTATKDDAALSKVEDTAASAHGAGILIGN